MKKICVLGSLNIDMTVSIPRFHMAGETIMGTDVRIFTGGKGGNQAIAAARLGAKVSLVACLGQDDNGRMYLETLRQDGIDVSGVTLAEGLPTGTALIEVVPDGDNRIAYVPGANGALTHERIDRQRAIFEAADILLFQLETPIAGAARAAELARRAGGTVILDPAPARPLDGKLLGLCDYLTPNETELALLSGMPVATLEEAARAAGRLMEMGAKAVLNKRGAQGALLVTAREAVLYEGYKVKAIDTTAAGDSFNAGFAVGLAMGKSVAEAIRLANAVGALSTTAPGAQAAMPDLPGALALAGM